MLSEFLLDPARSATSIIYFTLLTSGVVWTIAFSLKNKQVLVLTGYCPWKSHLLELEEEMGIAGELKYVLYAEGGDPNGKWRIQVRKGAKTCTMVHSTAAGNDPRPPRSIVSMS